MDAYLKRNLNDRVEATRARAEQALEAIMRTNAAVGRLASGVTLTMFQDALIELFQKEFLAAQQFIYNLTGDHGDESTNRLLVFGQDVVDRLLAIDAERVDRLGIQGDIIPAHKNRLSRELTARRMRMAEDFKHGMLGNERLKKDPMVSIHQSNSPGLFNRLGWATTSPSRPSTQITANWWRRSNVRWPQANWLMRVMRRKNNNL